MSRWFRKYGQVGLAMPPSANSAASTPSLASNPAEPPALSTTPVHNVPSAPDAGGFAQKAMAPMVPKLASSAVVRAAFADELCKLIGYDGLGEM